ARNPTGIAKAPRRTAHPVAEAAGSGKLSLTRRHADAISPAIPAHDASVACASMKHQHPAPPVENRPLAADAGDIVIAADDYARLRELCDGHTLADELDRAIVVPTDQMPAGI